MTFSVDVQQPGTSVLDEAAAADDGVGGWSDTAALNGEDGVKSPKDSRKSRCSSLADDFSRRFALIKYAALPVTHISQSTLSNTLSTAKAKRSAHVAATRATRVAATKQKILREAAIAFASACRDALTPALNRAWSNAWIPAGWKRNTLAVPRALDDLVQLLEDLHQFLKDNSRLENADYHLTATNVQDWLVRLDAAATELSGAKAAQRQTETALIDQARGLVSELELILPQSDERWIEFVSEVPSDEQRPELVEVMVLTSEVPGELEVEWEASVRAERY